MESLDYSVIRKKAEDLENDREFLKKLHELRREYGTLTREDLEITFTI